MNDLRSAVADRLRKLLEAQSKHSGYQSLHPALTSAVGLELAAPGKYEQQRLAYMHEHSSVRGLHVLDIGANTGYFSLGALAAGAEKVVSAEGNPAHAAFLNEIAQYLDISHKLEVRCEYLSFLDAGSDFFDFIYCLNVLHHVGDDFGDRDISIHQAKHLILSSLNALATTCGMMWMQIGFNWKGDRGKPLFTSGTKSEVIEFIRSGTVDSWSIERIGLFDPTTERYSDLTPSNLRRFEFLGEFLNRPLFLMKSKVARPAKPNLVADSKRLPSSGRS
ncbi:class I SAM-dependent methyltransferase [Fontimonas sp. SYSU GA230001]|uniref:class I SAM-dependent methyltransferase n=1 Tax=Fontimonas sp. SYSU GA230001 TaxID=3142450 RepID=UPI0032B375A5